VAELALAGQQRKLKAHAFGELGTCSPQRAYSKQIENSIIF